MTGAGRYVIELARRLPSFAGELTFHVFLRPSVRETSIPVLLGDAGVNVHYLDVAVASVRQWIVIPLALKRLRPDLYHYPFADLPYVPCPAVVTIYDLNHILSPQYFAHFTSLKRTAARILTGSTLRRAKAAFAISEETRRLISTEYPASSHKLRTIPLGVDAPSWDERKRNELEGEGAAFEPAAWRSRSYVLYVGVERPHKNLERLIRSFARFRRVNGWAEGVGPYLWLAGVGTGSAQLQSEILAANADRDVRRDPALTEDDLRKAYSGASIMAYLSTSEGFGLPILEAFAAGVPVITANTSSLPEVGGDAVVYTNPRDEAAISSGLCTIWSDKNLRRRLIDRGRERAIQFSWDRTARATAEAYDDVLRSSRANAGSARG